jgi:type VI secretion system protein ImpA
MSQPAPGVSSVVGDLLRPIDTLPPAGADLSYADVAALDRLATARPLADPACAPGDVRGDEAHWQDIGSRCEDLLTRTKDLRVALWYARAALATRGLAGLADGLSLVAGLLDRYWFSLHPRVDPLDDPQADERANLLAVLSPPPGQSHPSAEAESFHRALRDMVIAEVRGVGRVSVRHLDPGPARGSDTGVGSASLHVDSLLAAMPASSRAAVESAVRAALEALATIDAAFERHAGRGCRLAALQRLLERVQRAIARVPAARSSGGNDEAARPGSASNDILDAVAVDASRPSSRDDAIRLLACIATYVRASEPSSPAPLFIERAVALLRMDFAAIVRTLIPDARAHIELLGGAPLDADSP